MKTFSCSNGWPIPNLALLSVSTSRMYGRTVRLPEHLEVGSFLTLVALSRKKMTACLAKDLSELDVI